MPSSSWGYWSNPQLFNARQTLTLNYIPSSGINVLPKVYFMFMSVLPACRSVYCVHTWWTTWSEEGIRAPGNAVINCCKLP